MLQKRGMPRTARASVGGICYHVISAIGGSETLVRPVNPVYLFFRVLFSVAEVFCARILGSRLGNRPGGQP